MTNTNAESYYSRNGVLGEEGEEGLICVHAFLCPGFATLFLLFHTFTLTFWVCKHIVFAWTDRAICFSNSFTTRPLSPPPPLPPCYRNRPAVPELFSRKLKMKTAISCYVLDELNGYEPSRNFFIDCYGNQANVKHKELLKTNARW